MDVNLTSGVSTIFPSLPQELPSIKSSSTISLFNTCLFDIDYNVLKEHLENHQMQQSMLDKCLLQGFQILQRKERETSHMSATLKLLLRYCAKWDCSILLEHQMTPYHVICESTGDHHELLSAMLQSAGKALLNAKDDRQCTAMMCAVHNANLNCVKSLILHGADMNLGVEPFQYPVNLDTPSCPLIGTMHRLLPRSSHSTTMMRGIFDILLESGVDINITCNKGRTPIMYAAAFRNNYCFWKLAQKGFRLERVTNLREADVLEKIINTGISRSTTKLNRKDAFYWAVLKDDNTLIHYLLKLGVAMTNHSISNGILKYYKKTCNGCKPYRLLRVDHSLQITDPCYVAITKDQVNVVRLMEKYGCQEFKSLAAVRYALMNHSIKVANYLLRRYNYLINQYFLTDTWCYGTSFLTLLTEACREWSVTAILLLLKHGADPNRRRSCGAKSSTAMHAAIEAGHSWIISHFIRTGANINTKSYDPKHLLYDYHIVLPFEVSVLHCNFSAAEMLLVSGCSCGMFNLNIWYRYMFKGYIKPSFHKLMMDWEVQKNKVIPLQKLSRMSILKHLCPGAEKKITKLPLPPILITYLGIPELDKLAT